ncbi:MAG: hypothetical protein KAS12_01400 [Candidatus Aenigmarchaeota archaeon]|nr:hypothetical protein [Candidatus Aenigmarchaeota archaeon]
MYPPILCVSCGFALGDKYDIFINEMEKKIKEIAPSQKIHPEAMMTNTDLKITAGDILDRLQIKSECCRMHMIANVTFREYLG